LLAVLEGPATVAEVLDRSGQRRTLPTPAPELPAPPPGEITVLAAVQRTAGTGPGLKVARGMSFFGEHALGWLALGALGALVAALGREARTALLGAVALALPLAFLAVVPSDAVPVAGAVGALFPVEHAVRFFGAALYDANPWGVLAAEAAWLAAIALVLGALARPAARRLLV
jgi:hypothetical protein